MDNVIELRSRSRSKTPFLRSSCDRESCSEVGEHTHSKSGRRTPSKRNTPVKQIQSSKSKQPVIEEVEDDIYTSPPAHRTRNQMKSVTSTATVVPVIKTSDYSSEESPDRLGTHRKEVLQNKLNYQYEYEKVTTTTKGYNTGALADISLSPISSGRYSSHSSYNASHNSRYSPAHSGCSTDSLFAEQALADISKVVEKDHTYEHLPYKLYKAAGEYWNKYPKTDYTYSPLSKDRVELAPGQIAVPNMSRRSLDNFRHYGTTMTDDEVDLTSLNKQSAWSTGYGLRKRYTAGDDSSEDESPREVYRNGLNHQRSNEHWLLTQYLLAVWSYITTTTSSVYNKLTGEQHRYPYTDRRVANRDGIVKRFGSLLVAPFYWFYHMIKNVTTTTTEDTVTSNNVGASTKRTYITNKYIYYPGDKKQSNWWPWLLLLFLLPLLGYACFRNKDYFVGVNKLDVSVDEFKPPRLEVAAAGTTCCDKIVAIEDWITNVNSKMNLFNQKLSKLENLEATIEDLAKRHVTEHLQAAFNFNRDGTVDLNTYKPFFDQYYASKGDLNEANKQLNDKIIDSNKLTKDDIKKMIDAYISEHETRLTEALSEKLMSHVSELKSYEHASNIDEEMIKRVVMKTLEVYDADKTGIVDYALESAGGQIISTRCTELYQIKTKQYSLMGFPLWWLYSTPRYAITEGAGPAECWAFQGFPGYLVVRTYAIINATSFSIEHLSKLLAPDGKIEAAPRNFTVYGLREEMDPEPHLFGEYRYDANGPPIQYFPVMNAKTVKIDGKEYPVAYDMFELQIHSNHGNPTYTCLYRFRIHGSPLSDIRLATEDSLKDANQL